MTSCFRGARLVIMVFNPGNLDSFMELKTLNAVIDKYAPEGILRVLLARDPQPPTLLVSPDTAAVRS